MIAVAGTLVFVLGIIGLFVLDRDRKARTSKVLWIAVIWVFLAGSRPVSLWLHWRTIGSAPDDQLEGSPVDRDIFTALIVAAVIVLIARRRKVGRVLRANAPILLFLVYCSLSISWSDFPDVAFKRWIRALGDIAMVLVVLTDADRSAAIKRFLAWTGFLIIPLSILFDLGRGHAGDAWRVGLTMNKNQYGQISMILGLAAVWRFLAILRSAERKDRMRRLLAHGSVVALAMCCLWSANSGTSLASFLVGSFLIAVAGQRWLARKPVLVHLVVALVVFLAFYTSIINPNAGVVSAMGKDPTLTGRTDVWHAVIGMNPSSWFGAGFESFWLGSRLKELWHIFAWQPNEAHNGYIEVYLNLGWTGLILLAIVIVTAYRRVVRRVFERAEIGNLLLAYVAIAVVYSLTEAGFRIFSPAWISLLFSAIASTFEGQTDESSFATDVSQPFQELPELSRFCSASQEIDGVTWGYAGSE